MRRGNPLGAAARTARDTDLCPLPVAAGQASELCKHQPLREQEQSAAPTVTRFEG